MVSNHLGCALTPTIFTWTEYTVHHLHQYFDGIINRYSYYTATKYIALQAVAAD